MRGTSVLLVLALAACSKKAADDTTSHAAAPPVKVSLATVGEAETPELLTLTGMIAADQRAEVTADTQGKVLAVMVERGQRVRMGDPVVRLDVRSAALGAREAQANVAAARAQKQLADEECRRTKSLLDKGAITRSEYDRQATQCASSIEAVSAAQARAEMMSKSVADGLVRAPFDGMVAERFVTPGEWVAPGRALFTLVDDEPLKIELSVPENAVAAVSLDQRVTLTAVAVPCVEFSAKVSRVGAEVGRSRSLIVEATIQKDIAPKESDAPNCKESAMQIESLKKDLANIEKASAVAPTASSPGQDPAAAKRESDAKKQVIQGRIASLESELSLRKQHAAKADLVPGMFAEAVVQIGARQRAVVPKAAVATRGKTTHVFVVTGDAVEDRIVLIGPSGQPDSWAIVRGDVVKGQQIVAAVTNEIVDGVRVAAGGPVPAAKPAEAPPPAPAPPTPPAHK